MTARADVVAAARGWLGVPWRHQGRSRAGVDCAGLLIAIARELRLADVDVGAYPMHADGSSLRSLCGAYMTSIPIGDAAAGDVVLLCFRAGMPESHLALVTDYPRGGLALLHALNRAHGGGVIEHRLDAHWRRTITAAYRMPGVD